LLFIRTVIYCHGETVIAGIDLATPLVYALPTFPRSAGIRFQAAAAIGFGATRYFFIVFLIRDA
jgi:hypothetical protein